MAATPPPKRIRNNRTHGERPSSRAETPKAQRTAQQKSGVTRSDAQEPPRRGVKGKASPRVLNMITETPSNAGGAAKGTAGSAADGTSNARRNSRRTKCGGGRAANGTSNARRNRRHVNASVKCTAQRIRAETKTRGDGRRKAGKAPIPAKPARPRSLQTQDKPETGAANNQGERNSGQPRQEASAAGTKSRG